MEILVQRRRLRTLKNLEEGEEEEEEEEKKTKRKNKRKAYNTLRTQTIKAIRSGKKAHYKTESVKLKSLPAKQRKVARAKLKATLKAREIKLVGQLPVASKMALKDLDRGMKLAKKLRW